METLVWIIVCMLALAGVAAIVGEMLIGGRNKRFDRCDYRLITLYDDPAEVERLLNRNLLRLSWSGPDGLIILVDMGMGEAARKVCKTCMDQMYGVVLCEESELTETLHHLRAAINPGV